MYLLLTVYFSRHFRMLEVGQKDVGKWCFESINVLILSALTLAGGTIVV